MPLTPFADGVWVDSCPVSIVGMALTATMTVLRVAGDELLLHSPVELTNERRAEVEQLGKVAHLYAPNLFHHRWLGDWARAFPRARVHAPKGLLKKRPDLRIDRYHPGALDPALAGCLEEVAIAGFRLEESVLLHRPTGTLVVADLVHNIGHPPERWTRLYASAMGFYDQVTLSRAIRWTAFSDRAAARQCIDQVLALPFERLVVGHGIPIASAAQQALVAAYSWLPERKT